MPFFRPPTEAGVPTTLAYQHPGNALLRFYGPWREAVPIFVLTDGTITENYPIDDLTTLRRYYQGGWNKVTQQEVDALLAAGYGVTGNGEIAYEDMLITGDFVWQLVSGDTLFQVSA
jgi:hypothetical protein